jgi:hypothetical protein
MYYDEVEMYGRDEVEWAMGDGGEDGGDNGGMGPTAPGLV